MLWGIHIGRQQKWVTVHQLIIIIIVNQEINQNIKLIFYKPDPF